jgi:hypothetical protein
MKSDMIKNILEAIRNIYRNISKQYCFDIQMVPGTKIVDEATFAKILTKFVVGITTVIWSFIEIKEMIISTFHNHRRKVDQIKKNAFAA